MKKFNFLVFIVLGLFFTACNSEVNTKPKEVKFDREVFGNKTRYATKVVIITI